MIKHLLIVAVLQAILVQFAHAGSLRASSHCRDSVFVRHSITKAVVQWVDEQGRMYDAVKSEALVLQRDRADFDLLIHAEAAHLPASFKGHLSTRINRAYDWLAWFLANKPTQRVNVDLWVFSDRVRYQQFKKTHVPHLSSMSIGFHSSRGNIAAVWQKNNQQVLNTSVHEAIHVINSGMFGYLPRWVNEGLAEYIEDMDIQGQTMLVAAKPVWLKALNKSRLPLHYVLSSGNKQWNGGDRRKLYAHSWGLIYFLMSQPHTKMMLQDYLTTSSLSPCRRLDTVRYFGHHYPGGLVSMDADFSVWLNSSKKIHSY